MKSNPTKIRLWLTLTLIAVTIILLGYLRDSIFKSINALLRAWDLGEEYFLPSYLSFIENYEYDTLMTLKWILTFVFAFLYLAVSLFTIRILFSDRNFLKITALAYAVILIVSFIFMATGFVFPGTKETMYAFARFLMGLAQSPLILMILIPAFKLSVKEISKTPEL